MKENAELLMEIWDSIKPFIEKQDRIHVADNLVGIFDSYGLIDDVDDHLLDKELRAAVRSRFDTLDDVEDDELPDANDD